MKRQANVLSALIQNFDTVEKAIETSANSSGSALKENERYLDSIQGKIDQFNNATQAMWNNFLDADFVKGIVQIGTWLIKAIDKIGLLTTALGTIATISMVKNKMGPIAFLQGISDIITGTASKVKGYVTSIKSMVAANTAVAQSADLTTVGSLKSAMAVAKVDIANKNAILSSLGLASADKAQAISRDILTASTISNMVAEGQLTQAQANTIMSLLGVQAASNEVNAARMSELLMTTSLTSAQRGQIITQLGLSGSLKQLSADEVMNALTTAGMAKADAEAIMAKLGLAVANKGLAASFGVLWTAMWPILALMAGVAAIWGIVKAFDAAIVTTEELEEKVSDLNSELSDIESEIDSVNEELKTTKERMAELIAMPSLSFVEQEELANLKLTTAELERQLELKELLAESKEREKKDAVKDLIDSSWNNQGDWYIDTDGVIHEDRGWNGFWSNSEKTTAVLDNAFKKYEELNASNTKRNEFLNGQSDINFDDGVDYEEYRTLQEMLGNNNASQDAYNHYMAYSVPKIESEEEFWKNFILQNDPSKEQRDEILKGIDNVLSVASDYISEYDLSYGMSEDINAYLDEVYAYGLKRKQATGEFVKSDAISSLFDTTSTKEMQEFGKAFQEIADSDLADEEKNAEIIKQLDAIDGTIGDGVNKIDGKTDAYNRLYLAMTTVGVTAQDIADYFVLEAGAFDSNTVQGIANQYQHMSGVMDALKNMSNNKFTFEGIEYDWGEFFSQDNQGKFKANVEEFSEILKGIDNESRETFISIVESAANSAGDLSKVDWDQAIKKLDFSGLDRTFELLDNEFESLNNEMFAGAADDINGLIDTVSELQAALEDVASTMDLVHTAQTQMNSSGRISVKTALELMQTTDDWDSILEITNGTIKLRDDAEQHLIQTELTAIQTQLHYAWTTAQARYETALAAQGELDYANNSSAVMTAESIKAEAIGRVSAVVVALGAAMDKLVAGEWSSVFSAFGDTYKTATATVVQDAQQYATDIATLKQNAENSKKMYDAFSNVDSLSEFKDNSDFDENPGDKYDDGEDDAFQREMDYWENRIGANQSKYEQLQNEIDLLEAKGQKADVSYYTRQITLEEERRWLLEQQKAAALAHLKTLKEGSEEWWEVANTLNGIEGELDDVTASIVDLQDAIGEIDAYKFDEFNTRLDNLTSKLETIRNLIAPDGEEDWFDDEGNWTEDGIAVIGTYVQELETYKQGLAEVQDSMSAFNDIGNGAEWSELTDSQKNDYANQFGIHSEQEYYDKQEELISQQYDFAESISDTEQSIVDMYESGIDATEEYIETLIDGYNDYIDSVKEALDAERDLYDFKKNVQKQAKDIAEIERRIASLSGSTNKSDIAERRKLEAQLYESRESLNDTYYDHAKDAQNEALDAEASAYEETMNRMVEGMRASLEEATADMDTFLNNVTIAASMNADTVLAKYRETNVYLDPALTNPWENAKAKVGEYGGDATKLMDVWKAGGYFAEFSSAAGTNLSSPWSAGTSAANAFKTSVGTVMDDVVYSIASNVQSAKAELATLYQQIKDTEARAANANVTVGGGSAGGAGGYNTGSTAQKYYHATATLNIGGKEVMATGTGTSASAAQKKAEIELSDAYRDYYYSTRSNANDAGLERSWSNTKKNIQYKTSYYAKGTTGTARDEWAITDEPRFGDELTMYATPDGTLSFMRAGSTVIPADITKNLVEWGQFTPDAMNFGGGVNVNMINNAVNKPEFNFAFDALVKAENITEETLPAVKKLVTQELNRFTKELNYAIKGKGAR